MWPSKPIIDKLDKIQELQIEHTIQLARNTDSLNEHHVRTTNLEARIKPIESHVQLIGSLIKIVLALIGVAGTVFMILARFNK